MMLNSSGPLSLNPLTLSTFDISRVLLVTGIGCMVRCTRLSSQVVGSSISSLIFRCFLKTQRSRSTTSSTYPSPSSLSPLLRNLSIFTRWAKVFTQVGETIGCTFDFSNGKLSTLAKDAGFVSVTPQTHKIPIGRWPKDKKKKELGTFVGLSFSQALDGFVKLPLCEILKWSPEEMQLFAAEMRKILMNPKTQAFGHV